MPPHNEGDRTMNELTWEQEQDIADYEQWQAEQAWESRLGRIIAEEERAQEAEEDNPIDEYDDDDPFGDDWKKYDHRDYFALADYYEGLLQ